MSLPPFPPDYRASGVLLHVTSLPSPYGVGDVGAAALAWILVLIIAAFTAFSFLTARYWVHYSD